MNKLLQHIIDAGDVDHRVLPGLQKARKQFNAEKNPYLVFAQEGVEYKGPSIVDYLATKGYSGKKQFRKELADKYGIEGYDFSAAKNTELLNRLRESDELLRQYDQTMAPIPVERMMEMEQQARAARQAAAAQPNTQPVRRPAPVYNFSPEFQNMRIPEIKVNTSLQPKVIYDGKFSLTPKMVIPMPFGFNKTTPAPEVPNSEITDPVRNTPARPKLNLPQYNPFVKPEVKPELGPFISERYNDVQEVDPLIDQGAPEFLFNSEKLFNSFNRPKQKPLLPVVLPAKKPVVKTEKYTKPEVEELPWYEEAANTLTSTLKGFYNDFAEAVEKSPFDFGQMNLGTPMSPQGAQAMTRDLTKRGLSLFSPDMAEKYDNWLNRQQAIKNMDKDPVSKIVVPDFDYAPMYITGDTIPDSERQYHLAESMDLNALKFGVRNRGDLTPLDTEAASITAFHPFVDAKLYFTQIADDPANATYLGITPDGQVQVGGRKDVENKDIKISRVFSNKVVDFVRDPTGGIKKVPAGAKVNKNAFSPAVTVIGDDGKQKEGKLNLVVPQGTKADDAFGVATGGRFIFQTPDGQSRLVSGSLNNIEQEFKRIKGNNPYVTVISLDNGSFSRGLRTRDKRLTATDLRSYDNLNTGGGNFAYLLPNQQTSRPLAKFDEFEKEATKRLQALYPGKKVSVEYQDTGLYNQLGGRDIQTQADIQKKGNSQTGVSLHNFNAARDYVLYVDGKPINGDEKNKAGNDIYKEVLWKAADKTGVYHIDPWDVGHIGLAKEGQKTAFDELKAKYPEIFTDPNFVKSLEFINKNKNNPNYQEYYELLNNIQKFTGAPRTTEFMKQKSTAKKAYGGPVDLPKAQWGQLINPVTMGAFSTMATKLMDFFGLDEPKIVRTPASAPKRLSIRDPRKVMMTSGKPLRPNSDLVSGDYDSEDLGNLLTEAKRRKMSYNDMMNLAAMGFQETKWGKTDPNIGHTQDIFGDDPNPDAYENFINAYNAKMKDADRLKIKDEATRLQVYNGLGKVFPSTEADYHGFKMKKIYGVEVPKGGIDLRKNPLYGKQVIDIRDNVLKRNPEFMRYMDSTYRAPMPKEEEFANGGLVKMQIAGQYTAQRDATAVNTPVQSKIFGAQREIDVDRFSEDAFKQKYNITPHQYKMRTDSNYAQAFERQMDERRQNDPNYSELNLPATDVRSKNYRGNPNLAFIPKGATGPARAQQEQLFTDMTSLSAPLLPIKSLVRGLQVGKAASAAPKIIKQLSNPPSSIKITPEGSVNNYDPSWDTDIVWGAYQNRWQDTGGFEPVRDWPMTGPGFRNFNSNFYNRTNSIISNTVRNVDEKLGRLLSKKTNTPTFDPDEVTRLINENLSKGAGVKKENLPLQVRYAPFNNDEDTALRLETLIDNNKVGSIFLQRNMDPYKPKTLSEILLSKAPTPIEAWRNTPGFRKKGDFPFQYYDEFNPVKDPSGKVFNTVNDLYKTGVSGEFNKAINQALKEKGLGNVLSGGTGHSKLGEARWHHLVQKGLAEDLGGGYFKLKKQGGLVIDPRGQWAHPGKVTRIPSSNITMQGVPYPVYGVGSNGQEQMMYPGQEYNFGGASYVDEYPMMQGGGWSGGGLSRSNLETMAGLNKNVDHKKKYANNHDTKKTIEDVSVKEGYKDMRNFMDYWLTERAKDPKFTEWANKRLSVLNNLSGKYKTFTNKDIETGKAPYNALAFYNPKDSSLNFNTDKSTTYSTPVQLHELSHKMDYEDGTFYEKPRSFYDNNLFATPSSFISRQVIPKNKQFTNDRYAGNEDEYSYLSSPTEINARLNEFRYHYNLDPKKKYTAEDMKKIIKDHNNYNESFKGAADYFLKSKGNYFYSLDELLKITGNDPQKLADLHNNVVKNKTSYSSDDIPQVKNGGYTVTRSSDRKGKTHKVTGPDGTVKYFGDSKLGQHPKDPERKAAFYARHKKNLAGNPFFRAFARKTWEDGGETDYMQGGGLWDTDKVGYLDSTINANRNLEFIRRAIENDGLSIPTPKGAPGYGKGMTSSHLMTFDPKSRRSYPELVNMNGTLKYLTGDDAYNYAEDTGEYIQFPTAEQADYFSQNYKKSNYVKVGKQPLEKKHGIKVTYKK